MNKDELKEAVLKIMLKNRKNSGEYQYTVPSLDTYPFQWLWDSCFHAIIFAASGCLEDAKKELFSLVSHQFQNGMIPHMIYWDKAKKTDFPVIQWGKFDTSTITQPPMLAYAVWYIFQKEQKRDFLEKIYPNLKAYYNFLLTDRMKQDVNLLGIINPDESGEDNSPRFDLALNLNPKQTRQESFGKRLELVGKNISCNFETGTCMSNFFWVKDVPFNAIMIRNVSSLTDIAKELGKSTDAEYFSKEKTKIADAMKKWMYEDGLFWSTFGIRMEKITVKTWHIFIPLFAKLYNQKEAEQLVENYLFSNGFNTQYSVPTVAVDEPSYDPEGFWRGPVWMATNWFVYRGLVNYKLFEAAEKIRQSSIQLLEKSGFREQFHPETGEGLGAKDFTWGGLVLDMFEK